MTQINIDENFNISPTRPSTPTYLSSGNACSNFVTEQHRHRHGSKENPKFEYQLASTEFKDAKLKLQDQILSNFKEQFSTQKDILEKVFKL